jgi:IMP dehydrogenase/GMP reductase
MKAHTKFDLNDVLIAPEPVSTIESRYKDVNVFYGNGGDEHLPIIAAPMDTVIENNRYLFIQNSIGLCVPRTSRADVPIRAISVFPIFKAVSLEEFENYIDRLSNLPDYILIDIANGHMSRLYKALDRFKKSKHFQYSHVMIGNIANPFTYKYICMQYSWVHSVRIGIGNGNGCLTTQQTGIGYPMGSLIAECSTIYKMEGGPKIVADGGMKSYADIIKALALGAHYVMLGSVLNKALESAADTYLFGFKINQYGNFAKWAFKNGLPLYKDFRGMSTKTVQKKIGSILKTSEGIEKKQKVEYTLESWVDNFKHYLSSAMSYTNSRTLDEFIGNVEYNLVTTEAVNRYRK